MWTTSQPVFGAKERGVDSCRGCRLETDVGLVGFWKKFVYI